MKPLAVKPKQRAERHLLHDTVFLWIVNMKKVNDDIKREGFNL